MKITIGTAYPREQVVVQECRGRDLVTGLPKSIEITSKQMMEALEEPLQAICETVHACWSALRPNWPQISATGESS